jgi:hypothetical protein
MPNIFCPQSSPCQNPANPTTNYTSEQSDAEIFLGFSSNVPAPNPGDSWGNPTGYFYCSSLTSAEAAALCAYNGGIDNGIDDGGTGSNPPPNTGVDPGNRGQALYWNSTQQGSVTCPDGNVFTYTLPAMSVRSNNPVLVDRIAASIAQIRANRFLICISNISGACLNEEYDQLITATTQTTGDIDWQLRSGMLPPGIEMQPGLFDTSQISLVGTPTVAGNYTFTIRATDSLGNFMDKAFTLTVLGITNSPTTATQGTDYSFQFTAAGGTAPYSFSVPPGNLPDGLTMNDSGLVTGTPTDTIPTTFTVTVEDDTGAQCGTQFTMTPQSATALTGYWTFDHALDPVAYPGSNTQKYFTDEVSGLKLVYGLGLQITGYTDNTFFSFTPDGAGYPPWDGKFPQPINRGLGGSLQPISNGFASLGVRTTVSGGAGLDGVALSQVFGPPNFYVQVHTDFPEQWVGGPSLTPVGTYPAAFGSDPPASVSTTAYDATSRPAGKVGLGFKTTFGDNIGNPCVFGTDDIAGISWNPSSPGLSMFGWFKINATSTSGDKYTVAAIEFGDFTAVRFDLIFDKSSNNFTLKLKDPSNNSTTAVKNLALADDVWCFYCATFNNASKQLSLYINNAAVVQSTAPLALTAAQVHGFYQILQARTSSIPQNQLVGLLNVDEIGFSTGKVYSGAQVTALYNSGNGLTWPAVNSV